MDKWSCDIFLGLASGFRSSSTLDFHRSEPEPCLTLAPPAGREPEHIIDLYKKMS